MPPKDKKNILTENNTYQLIKELAEREKIPEKEIIEILSLAIQDAYHQKKCDSRELQVIFDSEKNQFLAYQVVNQVNDPSKEIATRKDNLLQKKCLPRPINLKKIINYEEILQQFCFSLQRIRQKKWSEEFLPLQGKIVEGTVQEVCHNYCLVSLLGGKGLGYWDKNEWSSREVPRIGQSKTFLVKEIKAEEKYPIILARCSEDFLRKLLEIEIPEIAQGKIIIQDILRWPRVISKVIMRSKVPINNLLGTCIGERGIRAQNIGKEMNPERIDLVEWREDKKEQLIKLFSPVEVSGFCKLQKKEDIVIIVRPEQLDFASKEKIVKLIEDYLKVKIQIRTWEEIDKENAVIIETVSNLKENWSTKDYPKLNHKLYGSK